MGAEAASAVAGREGGGESGGGGMFVPSVSEKFTTLSESGSNLLGMLVGGCVLRNWRWWWWLRCRLLVRCSMGEVGMEGLFATLGSPKVWIRRFNGMEPARSGRRENVRIGADAQSIK